MSGQQLIPITYLFKALTTHSRHLLRFWLRDPEYGWKTPEAIQWRWEQIYGGVTAEREIFALEPFVRSAGKGRLA